MGGWDGTVPAEVRTIVPQVFGDRGRAWLAALPDTVAELADRWGLTLGTAYGGGTHALVVPADRHDGVAAVLKVPVVDDENAAEWYALRAYDGDGAVRLLAYDPPTGALLLERAEPGHSLLTLADRVEAVRIMCALLVRLRRPVPADHPCPAVPALAARWADWFPAAAERHATGLPSAVLAEAVDWARRFAGADPCDGAGAVLVNRDTHLGNVLAAAREPWLLIDPKPLVGEPAFDGGWLMIDLLNQGEPGSAALDWCARIGDGLGVPADRVRGWALCRAVEDVFWSAEDGTDPAGYVASAIALASTAR
jgi:streptomycin 6-kinase